MTESSRMGSPAPRKRVALLVSWVLALAPGGCRSVPRLPIADWQAPGWTVRHGQAVWTQGSGREGIAGELLLATRGTSAAFVQFSKPPFTLSTARIEADVWILETQGGRWRAGGRGPAPDSISWFALVASQTGRPVSGGWSYGAGADGEWHLDNSATGERLEGYFVP